MRKVCHLRGWVKVVLLFILVEGFLLMVYKAYNNYESIAEQCDQAKGHTCSHYEIRQYSLGK